MAEADRDAVFRKVRELVVQELGVGENEVTLTSSFADDLGADSLAQAELLMAFEETYGIENIPDEDANKLTTVGAVVDYIVNYLENRPPAKHD